MADEKPPVNTTSQYTPSFAERCAEADKEVKKPKVMKAGFRYGRPAAMWVDPETGEPIG